MVKIKKLSGKGWIDKVKTGELSQSDSCLNIEYSSFCLGVNFNIVLYAVCVACFYGEFENSTDYHISYLVRSDMTIPVAWFCLKCTHNFSFRGKL
jgi:hypothetical protein